MDMTRNACKDVHVGLSEKKTTTHFFNCFIFLSLQCCDNKKITMASNSRSLIGRQGHMCSDCAAIHSVNKALVAAAEAGHNVCVDALVKAGADVNGDGTKVALIKAASGGCSRCADILIAEGTDVNKETMDHMSHTTLSLKPKENRVKCIEILIAAGANVNLQNRHGKQHYIGQHLIPVSSVQIFSYKQELMLTL